jgi:beta-1,4-mannosyltransferase
VSLIGFGGTPCVEGVQRAARDAHLEEYRMSRSFTDRWPRALFPISAPIKVILQVVQLFWLLLITLPRFNVLLVQNPPSIPTLWVGWIACRLLRARLVIDWHNFGYTILSHSLGERHPFVPLSRVYEQFCARRVSVCVGGSTCECGVLRVRVARRMRTCV